MTRGKVCVVSSYAYIERYVNYGSLLQYYALEKTLKEMNCDPYWLRYILPKEGLSITQLLKKNIRNTLDWKNVHRKYVLLQSFQTFVKNRLTVSERIYNNYDELINLEPPADAYIAGSDQVWGGTLDANYLCFVRLDVPRIAYAASFGKKVIPDEQIRIVEPWIRKFTSVSVREKSGVELCKSMGVKAEHVVDPTLLLDDNEYPSDNKKAVKYGKYIFGYFLNINTQRDLPLNEFECFAEKNNRNFICAGAVSKIDKFIKQNRLDYFTPEEWIGMYKNAEFIFTNTFHGTVFSIIFHKPFLVFLQSDETEKQNERIYSLLEQFGLLSMIYNKFQPLEEQISQNIDWYSVDNIRENKKKMSIQFLDKALYKLLN